jgi:hypothetical protein
MMLVCISACSSTDTKVEKRIALLSKETLLSNGQINSLLDYTLTVIVQISNPYISIQQRMWNCNNV